MLKTLLAWLVIFLSPPVLAMSLGEGVILSHVGEAFLANVALHGSYTREVSFSQVRHAECRASIIGRSANGCDALYEGPLNLTVMRRSDGTYYLRLSGVRSDELFYRIALKTSSVAGGAVYKAYEFLPEFPVNSSSQADVVTDDAPVTEGLYGVVAGEEVRPVEEVPVVKAARPRAEIVPPPKFPAEVRHADTRLEIKKYGEYADDIHALQKENGEIEEQIVLLEKHIGLLKEVIRLKREAGQPPEKAVPAPAAVPAVAVQSKQEALTWVLLAIVVALLAALVWMYFNIRKMAQEKHEVSLPAPHPASISEIKSLDLTGAFIKPKW